MPPGLSPGAGGVPFMPSSSPDGLTFPPIPPPVGCIGAPSVIFKPPGCRPRSPPGVTFTSPPGNGVLSWLFAVPWAGTTVISGLVVNRLSCAVQPAINAAEMHNAIIINSLFKFIHLYSTVKMAVMTFLLKNGFESSLLSSQRLYGIKVRCTPRRIHP